MNSTHHIKYSALVTVALLPLLILSLSASVILAAPDKDEVTDAPQHATGRIFLNNGDKLRGDFSQLNKKGLIQFNSTLLKKPVTFALENIVTYKLDTAQHPASTNTSTLARVELNSRYNQPYGDVLIGNIIELTEKQITLETHFAGTVYIQRPMVKAISFISNDSGTFYGPNTLSEWETPNHALTWRVRNKELIATKRNSIIGNKVKLQKSSYISFELEQPNNFQLELRTFTDNITSLKPKNGHKLTLSRSYATLSLNTPTDNNAFRAGLNRQRYPVRLTKKNIHFEVFIDAEAGIYKVFTNGQQAAAMQIEPLAEDLPHQGLSLTHSSTGELKLKNIIIRPWNGVVSSALAAAPDTQAPDTIKLNNGDNVSGTLASIDDKHLSIETEFTPITIPLSRIESFDLKQASQQPLMKAGDASIWLNNGSQITLKVATINEQKVTGYGQAYGELEIDPSTINRIDFNIYDKSLDNTRAKVDSDS